MTPVASVRQTASRPCSAERGCWDIRLLAGCGRDERRVRSACHFQVIPIHWPFEPGFRPSLNSSNPLHHRLRRTSCPFSSTHAGGPPWRRPIGPTTGRGNISISSFHMANLFNFSWPRPVRSSAFPSAATQQAGPSLSLAVPRRPTLRNRDRRCSARTRL